MLRSPSASALSAPSLTPVPAVAARAATALGAPAESAHASPASLLDQIAKSAAEPSSQDATGAAFTAGLKSFDGGPAQASESGFLEDFQPLPLRESLPAELKDRRSFVKTNELNPERSQGILDSAPAGVYLAVGTERGFIGAALAKDVSHLLLADCDPEVVSYNRTNAALLELARDRKEYLHLRLQVDASEWRRLAEQRGLPAKSREALSNEAWSKWRSAQQHNPLLSQSEAYYRPSGGIFVGSNYLQDDRLFAKLKRLADSHRISAVQVDLSDPEAAEGLARAVAATQARLAVLDLSNAHEFGDVWASLRPLSRVAAEDSVVMLTRRGSTEFLWEYVGLRLEDLLPRTKAPSLLKAIPHLPSGAVVAAGRSIDNPGVVEIDRPEDFSRVVAISDVHGMYEQVVRLLRAAGLIDEQNHWIGGNTLLLVLGDSIGRGPDTIDILDLWRGLAQEAQASSGRLIHLLGNHEARFLAEPGTDHPRTSKALLKELAEKGIPESDLSDPEQPRGAFLHAMPVAVRVGKWLFAHAGLYPPLDWGDFVALARKVVRTGDYGNDFLSSRGSILEAKAWWDDPKARQDLQERLASQELWGLVFGHEPGAFHIEGAVAVSQDGRLIKLDNGMTKSSGANPGSLLLFPDPAQMKEAVLAVIRSVSATGQVQEVRREQPAAR